jgi:hypothetical protein
MIKGGYCTSVLFDYLVIYSASVSKATLSLLLVASSLSMTLL